MNGMDKMITLNINKLNSNSFLESRDVNRQSFPSFIARDISIIRPGQVSGNTKSFISTEFNNNEESRDESKVVRLEPEEVYKPEEEQNESEEEQNESKEESHKPEEEPYESEEHSDNSEDQANETESNETISEESKRYQPVPLDYSNMIPLEIEVAEDDHFYDAPRPSNMSQTDPNGGLGNAKKNNFLSEPPHDQISEIVEAGSEEENEDDVDDQNEDDTATPI